LFFVGTRNKRRYVLGECRIGAGCCPVLIYPMDASKGPMVCQRQEKEGGW
jgi:hypothetical protein